MGNEPGFPFQGDICFHKEVSYGGSTDTSEGSAFMKISDKVLDVRLDTGDVHKPLRGISSPSVCGFIETGGDQTLHIEWILQPNAHTSLVSYCCERTTTGDVPSLHFEINASKERTTESFYYVHGCKCKSFTVNASRGEEYICSADFSVKSVATASSASETFPTTDIGTDYAAFNQAGSITFSGGYTAYITDSIEITVNHNLTDYWTVGSTDKLMAIPGALDVTGSADLSLDEGGAVAWGHIADVSALDTLIVNTGETGGIDGKFTLTTGRYDSLSVDQNISGGCMMASIPFTFKHITIDAAT